MSLNKLAKLIHSDNVKKGFYDAPLKPLEIHMLICSEVAEASESVRDQLPAFYTDISGKPQGELTELADALIRILDYAAYKKWDMDTAVTEKLAYNRTRPYKHGKAL